MVKKLVRFDWAMKNTMKLSEKERKSYNAYLNHMMSIASRNHTIEIEAKEIIKKAKENWDVESVIGLFEVEVSEKNISKALKIPIEKVRQIIENHKNKAKY